MKKVLICIAILMLTACAQQSRFDCPYGKGPSCLSMSEIDKHIKLGDGGSKSSCSKKSCASKSANTGAFVAAHTEQHDANLAQRIPETVLQMWVSPYEASSGIYYQASFVNIIVKDASWQAPVLDDVLTCDLKND